MQERRLPAWLPGVAVGGALALLVVWSFAERWAMLIESPFPVGIDGYFYPIQLRALLEDHALAYPASPLAFWLMTPFAAATDPVVGAKLGAAVFGALGALPAYAVGARLGKSRGAGLIAAALVATSAGSAFLTFEFVKNGIGMTLALTALWLGLRALETRTTGRIVIAIASVIAAFLAHKMAAGIVVVVAVPAVMAEAAGRGTLRGRRLLYLLGGLGALAAAMLALGARYPERFLSADQLALVQNAWTTQGDVSAPALRTGSFVLTMGYEAAIGGLLGWLALIVLQGSLRRFLTKQTDPTLVKLREAGELLPVRSGSEAAAAWMIVLLAIAISLPWLRVSDPQGIGMRIRIVAFVPMALCAAIVVRAVYLPIGYLVAKCWHAHLLAVVREGVLALVALVIVLAMPHDRTAGRITAHPAMVAAVQDVTGRVPVGDTVIVPERHISFMVAWYARVPTRLRPEGVPREHRWRLMPLAFIGSGSPLDAALDQARREPSIASPIGLHPRHRNGFVLVAEPTWEWILDRLPPKLRAYYASWPTI